MDAIDKIAIIDQFYDMKIICPDLTGSARKANLDRLSVLRDGLKQAVHANPADRFAQDYLARVENLLQICKSNLEPDEYLKQIVIAITQPIQ